MTTRAVEGDSERSEGAEDRHLDESKRSERNGQERKRTWVNG
ncbi:hypothetical protein ACFWJW_06490 [Streptomyces sp. NPDC127097]